MSRERRLSYRVRRAAGERAAGLAVGGVVVSLLGSAFLLSLWGAAGGARGTAVSQALHDEPAVLQRAVAARFCAGGAGTRGDVPRARGTGPGPAGGNPVVSAPTGALVAAVASVLPDTFMQDDRLAGTPVANSPLDPMNLVPYRGSYLPGWRSQTGLLPSRSALSCAVRSLSTAWPSSRPDQCPARAG